MRGVNLDSNILNCKVLVVGAGPTGAMLALCLKRYGINVTIIDQKDGPSVDSKALAVNTMSRIQSEIFFGKNVFGETAKKIEVLNISWNNDVRLSRVNLGRIDSDMSAMLVQTQDKTESNIIKMVANAGVSVRWNTTLTRVTQEECGVEVGLDINEALSSADKSTIVEQYDYVIGCEGKRSLVREAIGARLETRAYQKWLALADVTLETTLNQNEAHYRIFEDTFFVLVPLGNKLWRVVVKHEGDMPKTMNKSYVVDYLNKYLDDVSICSDPTWMSKAQLYVSYADTLQRGRLFIAGDAAHLYSPIGGTGMNTGFLDALNLGWKLASHIHRGGAEQTLLDSYTLERQPAIKENALMTDNLTQLISREVIEEKSYQAFLPLVSNRQFMRRLHPMSVSGMGLRYPSAKFSHEENRLDVGMVDIDLSAFLSFYYSQVSTSSPKYLLISLDDAVEKGLGDEVSSSNDVLSAIPIGEEMDLSYLIVCPDTEKNPWALSDEHHATISFSLWNRLLNKGNLILTRPDGIAIYWGEKSAYSDILAFFDHKLIAA